MLALILAVALSTVRGHVAVDHRPLPGCTVRLTPSSPAASRLAVTDPNGAFALAGVPEGLYEVSFELEGFATQRTNIVVSGDSTTVPTASLEWGVVDTITIEACTLGAHCLDAAPRSRDDLPQCAEYDLHTALIDAATNGDRSAIALLEAEHARTNTWVEKQRIAGALLHRSSRDAALWDELSTAADLVLRFPGARLHPTDEYLQWCADHHLDPDRDWLRAANALGAMSRDQRSHAVLLRALAMDDAVPVGIAIGGLAAQRDFASLPRIEEALHRFPNESAGLALRLADFRDERADAVAMKVLDGYVRDHYLELRNALNQDSPESR